MDDLVGLLLMALLAVGLVVVASRLGGVGSVRIIGRFDRQTREYAGDVELGMLNAAQQADASGLNSDLQRSHQRIAQMQASGALPNKIDSAIERHNCAAEMARTGIASWPSADGGSRSRRQLAARVRQMLGKNLRDASLADTVPPADGPTGAGSSGLPGGS